MADKFFQQHIVCNLCENQKQVNEKFHDARVKKLFDYKL